MCGAGGAGGAGPSSALWIGNGGGCDGCGGRGGDGRGANGSQAFPRFTGGGRARGPLVPFVQPRYFAQAIEQFHGQPRTQVTCVSRITKRPHSDTQRGKRGGGVVPSGYSDAGIRWISIFLDGVAN